MTAITVATTRLRQRFPLLEPAGVLLLIVGIATYVGIKDPNEHGHYPTCPFLMFTGYYCPGCGSLRAIHALVHLDIVTALRLNILTVCVMIPIALFYYFRWATERVLGRSIRKRMVKPWVIWTLFYGLLAFWLLRNLEPFAFLAPYGLSPN
ncbi:MAG TPA: DUF2752 domain-containing protein [Stackebrandtia sp.]|jgi:hypothetical protein|uniref:DUF2752 domain-containing protein n=1 Tax=Stackebrandtia sp. TaxID=2023065 RepID=UPI002D474A9A|nr:DUF2752 domain-containing protein [Stackebrandtia sp.]HZE38015.1 DUF2752 domain-containing protein [Stackebrandtia sp.]